MVFKTKHQRFKKLIQLNKDQYYAPGQGKNQNYQHNEYDCKKYFSKTNFTELQFRGGGCGASKQENTKTKELFEKEQLPINFLENLNNHSNIIINKAQQAYDGSFQQNEIIMSIQWFHYNNEYINIICQNKILLGQLIKIFEEKFEQFLKILPNYLLVSSFICYRILQITNEMLRVIFAFQLANKDRSMKIESHLLYLQYIEEFKNQLEIEQAHIWKTEIEFEITLIEIMLKNCSTNSEEGKQILTEFMLNALQSVFQMSPTENLTTSMIEGAKYLLKIAYEKVKYPIEVYEVYYYFQSLKWQIIQAIKSGFSVQSQIKQMIEGYKYHIVKSDNWIIHYSWIQIICDILQYRVVINKSMLLSNQQYQNQQDNWNYLLQKKVIKQLSYNNNEAAIQLFSDTQTINQDLFFKLFKKLRINQYSLFCKALIQEKFYEEFDFWTYYSNFKFKSQSNKQKSKDTQVIFSNNFLLQLKILQEIFESCDNSIQNQNSMIKDLIVDLSKKKRQTIQFKLIHEEVFSILQNVWNEIAQLILITNEIYEKLFYEILVLNEIFEKLKNSDLKNNGEFACLLEKYHEFIKIDKNKVFDDLIQMIRQAQTNNIQAQVFCLIFEFRNLEIQEPFVFNTKNNEVQEFTKKIKDYVFEVQRIKEGLSIMISGKKIELQFTFEFENLRKISSENVLQKYLANQYQTIQQNSQNIPLYFFEIIQFINYEQLNGELEKILTLKQYQLNKWFTEIRKITETNKIQENDLKKQITETFLMLKDVLKENNQINFQEWKVQKLNQILLIIQQSLDVLLNQENDSIRQQDQNLNRIYDFHLLTAQFFSDTTDKQSIYEELNKSIDKNLEELQIQNAHIISNQNEEQNTQKMETEQKSNDLIESMRKYDEFLKNYIERAKQLLNFLLIEQRIYSQIDLQQLEKKKEEKFFKTFEELSKQYKTQQEKLKFDFESENDKLNSIKEENLLYFFDFISRQENYQQFNLDSKYLDLLQNLNLEKPVERSIFQISKDYKVRECLVVNLIKLQASTSEEYIIKFVQQQIKNIWIVENDDAIRNLLKNQDLVEMQKKLFSHDLKSFTASIKSEIQSRLDNMQALEQELRLEGNQQLREILKEKLSSAYEELDQYLENIQDFGTQMNISLIFLKEISKDLKQVKIKIDALQNSLNTIQDDLRKLRGKKFNELLAIRKQKVILQKQFTDSDSVYISQRTIEYDPIAGTKIYDANNQEITSLLDEENIRCFKAEINEFLWDNSKIKDVLLLKGQAGSGKSRAARKIEEFLWKVHGNGNGNGNGNVSEWVPIYISLPSIKNPKFNLFEQAMESEFYNFDQTQTKEFKAAIQNRQIKVLFIFDSYDEMKQDCIQCNLINTNKFIKDFNVDNSAQYVKFIITTRIEILNTLQYKTWFFGMELYYMKEVELRSFDTDQVQEYLSNYVQLSAKRKIRNLYEYIKQLQEKDFDLDEFEAIWKSIIKLNLQWSQDSDQQDKLFDENQIEEIVKQLKSDPYFKYIKEEQIINLKKDLQSLWNQKRFQRSIKNLQIEHLLKTPFMLEIIVQVLPSILNNYSGSMSFREQFQKNLIKILQQQNKSKRKIAKFLREGDQCQEQFAKVQSKYHKNHDEIIIANQVRETLEASNFFQKYSPVEEISAYENEIKVSDQEYHVSQYGKQVASALRMKKYTGFQFYESFINFYHDQQIQKLRQLGKIPNQDSFQIDVYQFSQSFALDLTMKQLTQVSYQQKGKLKLETKLTSFQHMNNWLDQYFNDLDETKDYKKLIRSCVLLNVKGTSFSFIHKSIQEFLVAKYIYDTVGQLSYSQNQQFSKKLLIQLSESLYNDQNFNISSDNYLGVLELIRQELDSIENIDDKLIDVVQLSREAKFKRSASNSIYLLSVRNTYLGERDFNFIQLQDTNLCSLSFYACDLSFSKFENVKIDSCNFDYCNLNDAVWKNIDTNEKPYIENYSGEIQCLTISADDYLLAAGDSSGQITIYIISQFQQIFYSKKHNKSVNCLKFTKNSKNLLSCDDNFVYIWDMSNYDEKCSKEIIPQGYLQKYNYNFKLLLLSEDNLRLFTVDNQGLVIIWKLDNVGKNSDFYLQEKDSDYLDFVITKNSSEIYVINKKNKQIVNYQIQSQICIQQIPFYDLELRKLYLSDDDQYLVSIDYSSTLIIWDVSVKNQVKLIYFEDKLQNISDVQFSKNNTILQTFGNGLVICRDLQKMKVLIAQEKICYLNCQQITFSENLDFCLLLNNYKVYFVDTLTNQIINSIQTEQCPKLIQISDQQNQFAYMSEQSQGYIYDFYKFQQQIQISTHHQKNYQFWLSSDWKYLIQYDGSYLTLCDIKKMSEFQKKQKQYFQRYIQKFTINPKYKIVAIRVSENIILTDFELDQVDQINYYGSITCIKYSSDGENLFLGNQNGEILQLNNQLKQFELFLQFPFSIHSLVFSKDSKYLAVSSLDETKIINLKSKNEVIYTKKFDEQDLLEEKLFSSNLEFLVTGFGNKIQIHYFKNNDYPLTFTLNESKIKLFDLSPNEDHLVVLDSESVLFFIDLQSKKIKNFKSEYLNYLIYIKFINNYDSLLTVDSSIIRLWNIVQDDKKPIIQNCCQVLYNIQLVTLTNDHQKLFIYTYDTLHYFDLNNFYQVNAKEFFEFTNITGNYIPYIYEFSHDKKTLALGNKETIWLIATDCLEVIEKIENETSIKSIAISNSNRIVAYYGEDQFLRIKIIATKSVKVQWQMQIFKDIEYIFFTENDENIIISSDSVIMIINLKNLDQIKFIDAFMHSYYQKQYDDSNYIHFTNHSIAYKLEQNIFQVKHFDEEQYIKIMGTQNFNKISYIEMSDQYALEYQDQFQILDENLAKQIKLIENSSTFQISEKKELIAIDDNHSKVIKLISLNNFQEIAQISRSDENNFQIRFINEILISASEKEIVLFDISEIESINQICRINCQYLYFLKSSPNQKFFCFNESGRIKFIDLDERIEENFLSNQISQCYSIALTQDEKYLILCHRVCSQYSSQEQSYLILYGWDSIQYIFIKYIKLFENVNFKQVLFDKQNILMLSEKELYEGSIENFSSGKLTVETAINFINPQLCMSFSSNNRLIAFGGKDNQISIYEIENKRLVAVYQGHQLPISTLSFSSNGKMLASGSQDKLIRIWNINNYQTAIFQDGHSSKITKIVFSPDGLLLASASDDGQIGIWNVETKKLQSFLRGHKKKVNYIEFSKDQNYLVSCGDEGKVVIWNLEFVQEIKIQNEMNDINFCFEQVKILDKCEGILCLYKNEGLNYSQYLSYWKFCKDSYYIEDIFYPQTEIITNFKIIPITNQLIVRNEKNQLYCFNPNDQIEGYIQTENIIDFCVSDDGNYIIYLNSAFILHILDKNNEWQLSKINVSNYLSTYLKMNQIEFSHCNKKIQFFQENQISFFNIQSNQEHIEDLLIDFEFKEILILQVSQDSKILAVALKDKKNEKIKYQIQLINLTDFKCIKLYHDYEEEIKFINFSYDNKFIAIADENKIVIFDYKLENKVSTFITQNDRSHQYSITFLQFLNDQENHLLIVEHNGSSGQWSQIYIYKWKITENQPFFIYFCNCTDYKFKVSLSYLFIGCNRYNLKIIRLNLEKNEQEPEDETIIMKQSSVQDFQFNSNGKTLFVILDDDTIEEALVETGEILHQFTKTPSIYMPKQMQLNYQVLNYSLFMVHQNDMILLLQLDIEKNQIIIKNHYCLSENFYEKILEIDENSLIVQSKNIIRKIYKSNFSFIQRYYFTESKSKVAISNELVFSQSDQFVQLCNVNEEKILNLPFRCDNFYLSKTFLIMVTFTQFRFFQISDLKFDGNELDELIPKFEFDHGQGNSQNIKIQVEISQNEQFMASICDQQIIKLWNIQDQNFPYLQAIFYSQNTKTQILRFALDSQSFYLNLNNKITKYNLNNYFQKKVYKFSKEKEIKSIEELIIGNDKYKNIFSSYEWINNFNILTENLNDKSSQYHYHLENFVLTKDLNYLAISSNQFIEVYTNDDEDERPYFPVFNKYFGRLNGHKGKVQSLAISNESKFLISGSDDCSLILWDLKSCSLLAKIDQLSNVVNCLDFCPDGFYIAAGLQTGNVELYFQKFIDDKKMIEKKNNLIKSLQNQDGLGCIKVFSKQSLLQARSCSLERFKINEVGSQLEILFKQKQMNNLKEN